MKEKTDAHKLIYEKKEQCQGCEKEVAEIYMLTYIIQKRLEKYQTEIQVERLSKEKT